MRDMYAREPNEAPTAIPATTPEFSALASEEEPTEPLLEGGAGVRLVAVFKPVNGTRISINSANILAVGSVLL